MSSPEKEYCQPRSLNSNSAHSSTNSNNSSGNALGSNAATNKLIRPPSTTWGFTILDPLNKTNPMMSVDVGLVLATRAKRSYMEDATRSDANFRMHHKVCAKLGTAEGCTNGEACRHIHIHTTYLKATRAVSEPLCCADHNCYYTRFAMHEQGYLSPETNLSLYSRSTLLAVLPASKLSATLACRRFSPNTSSGHDNKMGGRSNSTANHCLDVDKDLCRLFQQGRCRWGKECSHVHLCRVEYARLTNRPTVTVARAHEVTMPAVDKTILPPRPNQSVDELSEHTSDEISDGSFNTNTTSAKHSQQRCDPSSSAESTPQTKYSSSKIVPHPMDTRKVSVPSTPPVRRMSGDGLTTTPSPSMSVVHSESSASMHTTASWSPTTGPCVAGNMPWITPNSLSLPPAKSILEEGFALPQAVVGSFTPPPNRPILGSSPFVDSLSMFWSKE